MQTFKWVIMYIYHESEALIIIIHMVPAGYIIHLI